MNAINLNLARKWRSKNFDQLVGQDLSVRMLKNSLYLNQYFPVYLFAGQRGCGKTSMARIFATAINCQQLEAFQKNPKDVSLPCLACASCQAMATGRHPDFVEIDAASHTGVDHMRTIIDAAQLLPVMGTKKIYLIDEAHMLSKASFNALLKILEEPPHSVIFILATTETQKIIDTVRSRCFQLLFKPIAPEQIKQHLMQICLHEEIDCTAEGIELIVQESEGSVRDALNMLEQARFSGSCVDKQAVTSLLGHMPDEQIVRLVEIALTQTPAALIAYVQQATLHSYSAEYLWERIQLLLKTAIWLKHGGEPDDFVLHRTTIKALIKQCSPLFLNNFLEYMYGHELLFNKTSGKHALLEVVLLQMCQKRNKTNDFDNGSSSIAHKSAAVEQQDTVVHDDGVTEEEEEDEDDEQEDDERQWESFIHAIETLHNPLLLSIVKQATFGGVDHDKKLVRLVFAQEFAFFTDWLKDTQQQWQPFVEKIFGGQYTFTHLFSQKAAIVDVSETMSVASDETPNILSKQMHEAPKETVVKNRYYKSDYRQTGTQEKVKQFDISDAHHWKRTHMILSYFPGTVTAMKENT